jgi:hypothetical protein
MTKTLLFLALIAAACSSDSPAGPDEPTLGKPFDVRANETAVLASEGLRITFQKVRNDSRCPEGVSCVWEGDAEVVLQVETAPEDRAEMGLHTNHRFPSAASFLKYRVVLQELRPLANASKPVAPEDYVATLVVSFND